MNKSNRFRTTYSINPVMGDYGVEKKVYQAASVKGVESEYLMSREYVFYGLEGACMRFINDKLVNN